MFHFLWAPCAGSHFPSVPGVCRVLGEDQELLLTPLSRHGRAVQPLPGTAVLPWSVPGLSYPSGGGAGLRCCPISQHWCGQVTVPAHTSPAGNLGHRFTAKVGWLLAPDNINNHCTLSLRAPNYDCRFM